MNPGSINEPAPLSATRSARQRWLAVLAKASLAELEAALEPFAVKIRYRLLRRGETGLVMVRGRIGGSGQPFNLGEMTMTRAAVQLLGAGEGATYTGFGHVIGRSPRQAELVALSDALLQDPDWHADVAGVVETLATRQSAAKAARAASIAASKVDFFTLTRGE